MSALLSQPGGFEGFGRIQEHLKTDKQSIPEGPEVAQRDLKLESAAPATHMSRDDADHLVPGIDNPLGFPPEVLPALPNVFEPSSNPFTAVIAVRLACDIDEDPLNLGVNRSKSNSRLVFQCS